MPSPKRSVVPVEQLLDAAQRRVEETTLRFTAAEIGMEHSVLNKLLSQGRKPHTATVRKLTAWYLKRAAAGELEVSAEMARVALGALVQHFPSSAREEAASKVTDLIRELTASAGLPHPGWTGDPST